MAYYRSLWPVLHGRRTGFTHQFGCNWYYTQPHYNNTFLLLSRALHIFEVKHAGALHFAINQHENEIGCLGGEPLARVSFV